jgi:hypothetical protein
MVMINLSHAPHNAKNPRHWGAWGFFNFGLLSEGINLAAVAAVAAEGYVRHDLVVLVEELLARERFVALVAVATIFISV